MVRGYRLELFREDLKKLYEMTGINQQTTVFLFNDTQVGGDVGEIWAGYGRGMREIEGRYGRDVREIWERYPPSPSSMTRRSSRPASSHPSPNPSPSPNPNPNSNPDQVIETGFLEDINGMLTSG